MRSRVGNLRELNPAITVEAMKTALVEAFAEIYGGAVENFAPECDPALVQRYRSWEWNFGAKLPFTAQWEDRLSFGCVRIEAKVENGVIESCKVWTDAMDWQLPERLEAALTGSRLDRAALLEKAPEFAELFEKMDL